MPAQNHLELNDGTTVEYDYLIIVTGPDLAFDEIPGLGPGGGFAQSVCHVDHAEAAAAAFDRFVENPGSIVVGAVQGASCFGPAYEFAMIVDTELKRRKIRDKAPMTFVTSEPYVGHLGPDGVGDANGLLESEMRERHIKWVDGERTMIKSDDAIIVPAGAMHNVINTGDKASKPTPSTDRQSTRMAWFAPPRQMPRPAKNISTARQPNRRSCWPPNRHAPNESLVVTAPTPPLQ